MVVFLWLHSTNILLIFLKSSESILINHNLAEVLSKKEKTKLTIDGVIT